jgi:hypothetical protein
MSTSRQQVIDQLADQLVEGRLHPNDTPLDEYELTEAEKAELLDFYKIERIFAFLRENYDPKVAREALYGAGNIPPFIEDDATDGIGKNGEAGE